MPLSPEADAAIYLASYGRRHGRRLKAQKQDLMDRLLPELRIAVPAPGSMIDIATMLPQKERWLEIGFGGGEHLAEAAKLNPDTGFVGCEPYHNGVASLLGHVEAMRLRNVRIFTEDARLLLNALPDASLDRIYILFPDPWRKVRHHKRRLVSLPTLKILARVLKKNGLLRLATDHADYASWMLEQALACDKFLWQAQRKSDWQQPPVDWVGTRYEGKAIAQGRTPAYYDFIRT